MIYNLTLGMPAFSDISIVLNKSSSVIPLLITLRNRSLPASGASVMVR